MKKFMITVWVVLGAILTSSTFVAPERYEIDLDASSIQWTAYHIVKSYSHTGNVAIKSGDLQIDNGVLVSGEIIMDMNSLTNSDLTKKKDNDKLIRHLKSEDFFHVSEYPESKLVLKNVKRSGTDKYTVIGDLTIRGITEEIEFEATEHEGDNGWVKYSTSLKVDRTKHKVLWGWSVGNVVVSDFFDLNVEISAKRTVN